MMHAAESFRRVIESINPRFPSEIEVQTKENHAELHKYFKKKTDPSSRSGLL